MHYNVSAIREKVRAYTQGNKSKQLIQSICEMEKDNAAAHLRAFCDLGGDLGDAIDWISHNKLTDVYKLTTGLKWAVITGERLSKFIEACIVSDSMTRKLTEPLIKKLADSLVNNALYDRFFLKDKVIGPLLTVGKLDHIVTLARQNINLLDLALPVLRQLSDDIKTDYEVWPKDFEQFKLEFKLRTASLPNVDQNHKYVVFSDMHMESAQDIQAGINHFNKNRELFKRVLTHYAENDYWTVITLGDCEEFWYCDRPYTRINPLSKVKPIIDNYSELYCKFSNDFYENFDPHRFIKIRGNHDEVWLKPAAVNILQQYRFPDIQVHDFALVKRNGTEILLLHGHQFDMFNCDAHNFLGKFAVDCIGDPLDRLDLVTERIFNKNIEGFPLAPFYEKNQWLNMLGSVQNPKIEAKLTCNEELVVEKMRQYGCSIIMGHTHKPKIMKDSQNNNLFYVNSGTSGWWEGCVWTVEITPEDITLKGWEPENNAVPHEYQASYVYSLTSAPEFS
jgi:UDP-2,3-diacylglucosamine pyrophosphatase LpxH